MCLLFGHSLDDCPTHKRVENQMNKGKGQNLRTSDEGFIEVKRKKLGGNNVGNKHFKSVSVIIEGKLVLVDADGKPLEKVYYMENSDSDDEVEPVENENASFLASNGVEFGLKSPWEQWRDTTMDDEYDPYDDDMYEGQDIPENIQTMCDHFDIKFQGRKKK
ncbi:hypothetical protein Tco_1124547 [Tanacetum coccineum]|uniref:Uncharacterized protein n=1 Tax=Tanacetum coccineum TaxID=301880 RepID=A0ABQ5J981_9ASTR